MEKKYDKIYQIVHSNISIEDKKYKEFRRQWEHYSTTLELSPRPLHIDIEVTNACNLRCLMCERKFMNRKLGYMGFDLFCSIIDQCVNFDIYSVKLNLWGESLLHKDFFKMIKYAKGRKIHTQFNTNATFATEEVIKKLVASGLDKITVSVESITKNTYEDIRKGAEFNTIIKNIEGFIRLKPVGQKPLLTLQFIRMKKNYEYIAGFIEKFEDKVDFVSVTNINCACGDKEILKESMIDYTSLPKLPCSELWRRLSVFWNGEVTACCNDYEGFLKIGNIKNNSLMELWHSKEMNEIREKHKKLDFSGLICKVCTINCKT